MGFEFASFTAYKVNNILDGTRNTKGAMERSGLYKDMDFEKYKFETKTHTLSRIFDPYRSYRVAPNFKGKFVNTDKFGRRYTKGSLGSPKKDEIIIAVFGGSTSWGIGSESDLHTIPSLLFSELNKNKDSPFYKVFNYGIEGYNQTQEMIYLIESLRSQQFNIVIFYDFVNESLHGYREVGRRKDQIPLTFLLPQIPTDGQLNKFAGFEKPLISKLKDFIRSLYSYRMLNFLKLKIRLNKEGNTEVRVFSDNQNRSAQVNRVIENYHHNIKIIRAIGKDYNFIPIFILQPTLFTKKKLSDFEKTIDHLKFRDYIEFEKEAYKKSISKLVKNNLVTDFSDIFSGYSNTIYIDDHHMSSVGNKIAARHMAELVIENLN